MMPLGDEAAVLRVLLAAVDFRYHYREHWFASASEETACTKPSS
jgi:hypothetical protein